MKKKTPLSDYGIFQYLIPLVCLVFDNQTEKKCKYCVRVYMDFCKAFDSIDHEILLPKLC